MKNLIEVFKDTREKSKTDFAVDTANTIRNTHVYLENDYKKVEVYNKVTVNVTDDNTISAMLKLKGKLCALNFADGYTPGGLVLQGVKTQEEGLCRSSNLYESLLKADCKKLYYDYNKEYFGNGSSSHRIIYSPNVLFFKDDKLDLLSEPIYCDIITCPAPHVFTLSNDEIYKRMQRIIYLANLHNIDSLILGNWGCGAFGNDLVTFTKMWKKVISEECNVPNVIFASLDQKDLVEGILHEE